MAADLLALPFPDGYADEARAIHVIEHFQVWDAPTAMAEWVRVLKPGGVLAATVPAWFPEKVCWARLLPVAIASHGKSLTVIALTIAANICLGLT